MWPKLSINICGKATAADYLATSDASSQEAGPVEAEAAGEEPAPEAAVSADENRIPPEELTLTDVEAQKLLDIATARTQAARTYLVEIAGLDKERIGQCRITYSMKDKKPPRVEVRF